MTASTDNPTGVGTTLQVHLRMWPVLVIASLHLVLAGWFVLIDATHAGTALGLAVVPFLSTLLFIIWWLVFSRAPLPDRPIGALIFFVACAGVVGMQNAEGIFPLITFLLVIAFPTMTLGLIALLAATARLRWPIRRWLCVGLLVLFVTLFACLRVGGFTQLMIPVLTWR